VSEFLTSSNGKAVRAALLLGCTAALSAILAGYLPVGGWVNDIAAFGIVASVLISAWLSTTQGNSSVANG